MGDVQSLQTRGIPYFVTAMPKRNQANKQKRSRGRQNTRPPLPRAPVAIPKSSLGRSLLTAVGGGIGGLFGGPAGVALGGSAGNAVATLLGMGDYAVRKNTLISGNVPNMHSDSSSIRVTHKEYIRDIYSSTTFSDTVYSVNPGHTELFPWLNNVARSFQQYQIHGMVFQFKSHSADALNSTNTNLGTVSLCARYNAVDTAPFTEKVQMLNEQFAISGKPSSDVLLPLECDPKQTTLPRLFVDHGIVDADSDPRLYDMAVVHIATYGMQAASVSIGELWCSYDIEFFKPSTRAEEAFTGATTIGVITDRPTGAGVWFPSTPAMTTNGLGITFSNNTMTFPAGIGGDIEVTWVGAALDGSGALAYPVITDTNATATAYKFTQDGVQYEAKMYSCPATLTLGSTSRVCYQHVFHITNRDLPTTITYSQVNFPSTDGLSFVIRKLPDGVASTTY